MEVIEVIRHFFHGLADSLLGVKTFFCLLNEERIRRKNEKKKQAVAQSSVSQQRGRTHSRKPVKEKESIVIYNGLIKCMLLNGSFVFGSYLLVWMMIPALKYILPFIFGNYFISVLFEGMAVFPAYFLAKVFNSFWCQDIASSAYKSKRGKPVSFPSITTLVADTVFSLVLQCLFFLVIGLVGFIPNIGFYLSQVLSCLLYSLYAFEYKWTSMGWGLDNRLPMIEMNLPYFLGFGLPLAALLHVIPHFILRGSVFSLVFPILILSGNEANPPRKPSMMKVSVFTPVVYLTDWVMRFFVWIIARRIVANTST